MNYFIAWLICICFLLGLADGYEQKFWKPNHVNKDSEWTTTVSIILNPIWAIGHLVGSRWRTEDVMRGQWHNDYPPKGFENICKQEDNCQ